MCFLRFINSALQKNQSPIMSNQPKSMHQIRQVLEHLSRGTSISKIAGLLNMSRNTVKDYRDKFLMTGVTFIQLLEHNEIELSLLIRSKPPSLTLDADEKRMKDFSSLLSYFLSELRKTGVTKQLLWQEYLKDFPDGYRYTRFCYCLSQNQKKGEAVMRMIHLPGEMLQVGFAGSKLHDVDREK